jgi:hypothetical protein
LNGVLKSAKSGIAEFQVQGPLIPNSQTLLFLNMSGWWKENSHRCSAARHLSEERREEMREKGRRREGRGKEVGDERRAERKRGGEAAKERVKEKESGGYEGKEG